MSLNRSEVDRLIRAYGVIAILRGDFSVERLATISAALNDGGVNVVEITLNSRDALKGIEKLRSEAAGDILIGAGTVLTAESVDDAVTAGAQFIVSPNLDARSLERSRRHDILHLPGVFTATEAQSAFEAGCRTVKLFPCDALGPKYLRALRAPLNDIGFVPTGGIDKANLAGYIRAGAVAVGVGSSLVPGPDAATGEVAKRAREFMTILESSRRETVASRA